MLSLVLIEEEIDRVKVFRTGATQPVVCRSDASGTNRASILFWGIGSEVKIIGKLHGDIHHTRTGAAS